VRTWDVKRKSENRISVSETKSGSTSVTNEIHIFFFRFSSRKLHKNYHMSGKINSHICSMFRVTKVFIKRSNMAGKEIKYYKIPLGLKFKLLWRPVKPKIGFKPIFNKRNPVFKKTQY